MNEATNPTGAERSRVRSSAVFGWAVIIGGLAAALGLLRGGQELAARLPVEPPAAAIVLFYFALFLPLALLGLILGLIERRPILRVGRQPIKWTAIGLAVGIGGLVITASYIWINGTMRSEPLGEPMPGATLAMGLALSVLTVGAEEILFRGWLLSALEDRVGQTLAVVLSAVAFSGFHVLGGAQDPLSLVNLMLGGIWFALLAQRSGGLLAPFFAHLGWNVTEELGFGLVPGSEFGSLLNHEMIGPALWGGSDEGLNASIAMSVVLIALIVPLLPLFSRSAKRRS